MAAVNRLRTVALPSDEVQPDASANDLALAEMFIRNRQYSDAVNLLCAYLRNHDDWRAHYDLGYALLYLRGGSTTFADNLKRSIQELSRSLQLNIRNADAHKMLGLDMTMIRKNDLAIVEFQQAIHNAPDSAEAHYFLARTYMTTQNYAGAEKELEEAIRCDPRYMKAYDNLGIVLDMLGDRQGALTNARKAVELDELTTAQSELPHLNLARLYRESGDTDRAIMEASAAVNLNPRSEESLIELGTLYRERSEWDKALAPLLQAVALNPGTPQTYFLLGRTYKALGREPESHAAFRKFVKYRTEALGKATDGAVLANR